MDFSQTIFISGLVTFAATLFSIVIYGRNIREIITEITPNTRRALMTYGAAGISMAFVPFFAVHSTMTHLVMGNSAIFLGLLFLTQINILYPNKKLANYLKIIIILLMASSVAISAYLRFVLPPTIGILMVTLLFFLGGGIISSIVLVRENPTVFSVSFLVLELVFVVAWLVSASGWLFVNPEFFIINALPLLLGASIFASIRKPVRTMLTIFLILTAFTIGSSLVIVSFQSGETIITLYSQAAILSGLAMIIPLNYFIQQAQETGTKAPRYIALVIGALSLMIMTHALSFSIYQSEGAWNQYFVWFDVVLGMFAVGAFVLAGVVMNFGNTAYSYSREFLNIYGSAIVCFAFPDVIGGRYEQEVLWLFIGFGIAAGMLLFIRTSIRIARLGAGTAAFRFILFITSALAVGIVSMFSDNFPFGIVLALLAFSVILSLANSPPVIRFISRRTSSQKEGS
ncbi:MAG: hypothetical protein GF411_19650 [Candidatus Lokiarchaeota archaeon]|nr:hypothetical protein [Candidatus Lokiarchaeota archaeon]